MNDKERRDLIRMIEAAPEGSAEIEARIWCALTGMRLVEGLDAGGYSARKEWPPIPQALYREPRKRTDYLTGPGRFPAWTRVLDHARAFVRPGFVIEIVIEEDRTDAAVKPARFSSDGGFASHADACCAIALAALRAGAEVEIEGRRA